MSQYDNTNSFTMFRNERKQEGSRQPDYTGTININGEEYELAGWVRTAKSSGKKFTSGTVKPKQPAPSPSSQSTYDDSEIPF